MAFALNGKPVVRHAVGAGQKGAHLRLGQLFSSVEAREVDRHGGVVINSRVGFCLPAVGVASVRQINVFAKIAVEHGIVVIVVSSKEVAQRATVHVRR